MSNEPTLRELRYFVTVYQERSFSGAARALYMTQPPLSQAIASLERTLGVTLFERSTRELRPTAAAEALLPDAIQLLQRAAELPARVRSARAAAGGLPTIRIGAVSSLFTAYLPGLLPELTEIHPSVSDLASSQALADLHEGRLDVTLTREALGDPEHEQLLLEERFFIAVPSGHRFAGQGPRAVEELRDEPLILYDRSMAPFAFDAIAACFRDAGVPLRPTAHIRSEQAALGLVRAGLGISLVPELLTAATWDGVEFLPLRDTSRTTPLWCAVASGDPFALLPRFRRASDRALNALDIPVATTTDSPHPKE
jgi:DNA-binding transcriptional LysR family regulator